MNQQALLEGVTQLRVSLEGAFSPDTAAPGFAGSPPSRGHCAVVALIMHDLYGGELLRTRVKGEEHWLNRVHVAGVSYDVDLTGDQFGLPTVQVEFAGKLYEVERVDAAREILAETVVRAIQLAARAQLPEVATRIPQRFGGLRATSSG
jgi:hypothetical protein